MSISPRFHPQFGLTLPSLSWDESAVVTRTLTNPVAPPNPTPSLPHPLPHEPRPEPKNRLEKDIPRWAPPHFPPLPPIIRKVARDLESPPWHPVSCSEPFDRNSPSGLRNVLAYKQKPHYTPAPTPSHRPEIGYRTASHPSFFPPTPPIPVTAPPAQWQKDPLDAAAPSSVGADKDSCAFP